MRFALDLMGLRRGALAAAALSLVMASAGHLSPAEAQRGRVRRAGAARRAGVKIMTLKAGRWGGPHVSLVAGTGRVTVEFDCAHGEFAGPVALDAAGRFEVVGTYVREGGGPSRVGADQADSAPVRDEGAETFRARYSGVVEGSVMRLAVKLVESGAEVGSFRLRRGQQPGLQKCQ